MANNQQGAGDADFTLKCQIIDEVQQRPILYNKGHPMYFIRNAKNDEFATIGLALGITNWKGIDLDLKILQFTSHRVVLI